MLHNMLHVDENYIKSYVTHHSDMICAFSRSGTFNFASTERFDCFCQSPPKILHYRDMINSEGRQV